MKMFHQVDEWEDWRRVYVNTAMKLHIQYKSVNFVPEERAGSKRLRCNE